MKEYRVEMSCPKEHFLKKKSVWIKIEKVDIGYAASGNYCDDADGGSECKNCNERAVKKFIDERQ